MSLTQHLNFNCETKVTVSESASIILSQRDIFLALKSSPSFLSSHIYLNHDKEKGHAELRGEQKKIIHEHSLGIT